MFYSTYMHACMYTYMYVFINTTFAKTHKGNETTDSPHTSPVFYLNTLDYSTSRNHMFFPLSMHTRYGPSVHPNSKLAIPVYLVRVKARQCLCEGEEVVQNGPDQFGNTEQVEAWGERRDKDHILPCNSHRHTHQRRDGATLVGK